MLWTYRRAVHDPRPTNGTPSTVPSIRSRHSEGATPRLHLEPDVHEIARGNNEGEGDRFRIDSFRLRPGTNLLRIVPPHPDSTGSYTLNATSEPWCSAKPPQAIKETPMRNRFQAFTSRAPSRYPQALLAICVLLAVPSIAPAQWRRLMNPLIPVSIEHPPRYVLSTDKIIVAPAVGACGDDITAELITGFADRESEVLGREDLALILNVLDLGARSGYSLDKDAALAVGQHVGPGALLRIHVTQCDSERIPSSRTVSRKVGKGDDATTIRVKVRRSTTEFRLRFSVNVTNLATGVTYAAETFSYSPSKYNESEYSQPEYPSAYPLQESALQSAVPDVSKLLFPWTEVKGMTFFNSTKNSCNLKLAHLALVAGDNKNALDLSKQNIELCNSEPKASKTIRSNAYYNAGVMYRVAGEFDTALEHFQQAADLKPGAAIVEEAIQECLDAQEKRQAMLRFEEETDEQREALQAEVAKIEAANEAAEQEQRAKQTLTNEEITLAVRKQLPEWMILARIEASGCDFDLSVDALAALHDAGVPKAVITAMIGCEP